MELLGLSERSAGTDEVSAEFDIRTPGFANPSERRS